MEPNSNFLNKNEFQKLNIESILETLPTDDGTKVDFLLTSQGLKRASDFHFNIGANEPSNITEQNVQKAKDLFKTSGLVYVENNSEKTKSFLWKEFIIGRKIEDVLKVQELWNQPDKPKRDREIGELFGFPKTSIDAYVNDQRVLRTDLPNEIKKQDYMAFGEFTFSKENLNKELEVVKKWAEAVMNLAPKIYGRIVDNYKKELE